MKKSQFANISIGQRYYTYNEQNELKTVRIKHVYGQNRISVYDEMRDKNHSFILTYEDLNEKYTKLRSDMSFTFGTVFSLKNGSKDVMVTMFRQGETVPYLVCRQMMVMNYKDYEAINARPILGTVLVNVNENDGLLENMMQVSMGNSCSIEGYIDDNLSTIMNLIPRKILMECNEFLKNTSMKLSDKYDGLEPNLRRLLDSNHVWDDINRAFNIYEVPFVMHEEMQYDEHQLNALELITSFHMSDIETIRYAKDVDLTKLKTDYILVRDKLNILYLVVYIRGDLNVSLLDKEGILTEEEIEKLMPCKN